MTEFQVGDKVSFTNKKKSVFWGSIDSLDEKIIFINRCHPSKGKSIIEKKIFQTYDRNKPLFIEKHEIGEPEPESCMVDEKEKKVDKSVLNFIKKDIKEKTVKQILKDANDRKIDYKRDGDGGILIEDRSYRGFVYERLWDICIKFGVVDGLTMKKNKTDEREEDNTCHLFGNLNRDTVEFKPNCWIGGQFKDFLFENVQSGNSGGYSDISFLNKYKNKDGVDKEDVYFISVKYYEDTKSVDNYDIGKLCTLIEKHNKARDRNINILIFVKDKNTLIGKFKKQQKSSDIMMKYIDPSGDGTYQNIYDQKDLEEAFYKLKLLLEQYNYLEDDISRQSFEEDYLQILKSPFIPRFHQKLFIDKINELILKDNEKKILVGAIPRSGKSYIMGGTILDFLKNSGSSGGRLQNFLLITPAPTETFGEYRKLFENYIDFHNKIEAVYLDAKGRKGVLGKQTKHRVYIASKQLLGWDKGLEENKEENKELKKNSFKNIKKYLSGVTDFNLIFLDEAHFGLSTKSSKLIMEEINKLSKNADKTPTIFVTATYNKPSRIYNIKEECKLTWDVNDVQIMKELTKDNYKDNNIRERFGEKIYDNAIITEGGEVGIPELSNQYSKFPKPYLITSVWDKEYVDNEIGKIGSSGFGFDMNELFKNDGTTFDSEENVGVMMRYYFGTPDKKEEYNKQAFYRNRGILPRIKRICSNGCRTLQSSSRFKTSQLWFLPYGPGNKIAGVVNSLLNLLNSKNEFNDIKKSYHFYVAVEDDSWKGKKGKTFDNVTYMDKPADIRYDIERVEKQISDGELKGDNLIILAGARLQLGISFVNVDIVALWNTVESTDANFQMLFRSMTEKSSYENCKVDEYCGNKTFGFMVDLNPQRVLKNLFLFQDSIRVKNKELTDKERNIELSKIINIDEDVMQDKFSGDESKRDDFITELFNKFYSSWNDITKTVQKTAKSFSYNKDILKNIEKQLRNVKIAPTNPLDTVVDPDNKIQPPLKNQKPKDKTKKQLDQEKKVMAIPIEDLAAEALADIISLMNIFTIYISEKAECILLEDRKIPEVKSDIGELKDIIWKDEELKTNFLETLNTRLGGFGGRESIEQIIDTLKDSITSDEDIISMNRLIMTQKKQIYTIREPDKLLEYINDNLAPKEKERKEKGEVFTPIYIVQDMLDNLPKHVWSDHTLKWLDPAVGIGNFPICVYLRLMEGLKSWEPNEEKRRKHIIEKMLFMVEISKKSILILNKIFCGTKYKLNIHNKSYLGDTYNPGKKFNIIMGNPPYNEGGTGRTSGSRQPFWPKFVDKSLLVMDDEKQSYLLFIHPCGWRKPYSSDMHKNIGRLFHEFSNSGSLLYIKMTDETIPNFPPVDIYLYTNKKNKSTIVDSSINGITFTKQLVELSKLVNENIGFIPSLVNKDIINIITKVFKKRNDNELYKIEYDGKLDANQGMRKNPPKGYPYAFYYDNGKYVEIYSNKNIGQDKDYFKKSKIIMTFNGSSPIGKLHPVYYKKPIGTTTYTLYYLTDNDKEITKHVNFFDSKLINFLMIITQYSPAPRNKNDQKILNNIQIPNLPNNPTDKDIYKYYGITKEEQKIIEEVVNYTKPSKRVPKLEGQDDPALGVDPDAPPAIDVSRKSKSKTLKKKKCSEAHPPGPPCKENQYVKQPSGCCYNKPKTTKKKKGGGKTKRKKKNRRTIRKKRNKSKRK
jgi:hypothetical protein